MDCWLWSEKVETVIRVKLKTYGRIGLVTWAAGSVGLFCLLICYFRAIRSRRRSAPAPQSVGSSFLDLDGFVVANISSMSSISAFDLGVAFVAAEASSPFLASRYSALIRDGMLLFFRDSFRYR